MDRDYDGRLSFGEFMGEETPLEKVILMNIFMGTVLTVVLMVVQVFKNMDKDGSGTVSKDEFLKICKNLSKEQVEAHSEKYKSILK